MSTILSGVLTALEPWKGLIASVAGFCAALLGILGGIIKQRRASDTTTLEPPLSAQRTMGRMHPDDRDAISDVRSCIGDLRESVEDLTRITRQNTKAVEDNTEAFNRRPAGGGRR